MFLVDDRKNQDRSSSRGVQVGDGGMAKVVEKINRERADRGLPPLPVKAMPSKR